MTFPLPICQNPVCLHFLKLKTVEKNKKNLIFQFVFFSQIKRTVNFHNLA